jgi:hypothetical protein
VSFSGGNALTEIELYALPEPGALALMAVLAAAGLTRRARRRAARAA